MSLPIVVMSVLLVIEVGLVFVDQIRLVHVCRDATRRASLSADPASAARTAVAAEGPADVEVRVEVGRLGVTVSLEMTHRTELPLIGPLLPDVHLHESLTMGWEGDAISTNPD